MQPTTVEVSQRAGGPAASTFGSDVVYVPSWGEAAETLANTARVWGHRREFWRVRGGAAIGGVTVWPVQRVHVAASAANEVACALHFEHEGLAFEVQFAGSDVQATLIVEGAYAAPGLIATTLSGGVRGAALSQPEALVRFQFDRVARRRISLYGISSLGPVSVGVAAGDSLRPWDRSDEASCAFMTDSYGGAFGPQWRGGPFFEAAARLGIPHVDIDTIGGTGYAPNNANAMMRHPGNAFPARLAGLVAAAPDLVFTAGGLNDNNSLAAPPLYATGDAARLGFEQAVHRYYGELRAALPQAVLVAMGPWAPRQSVPTDAVASGKAATVRAALQAAGAPWVFLDNLEGGWRNSTGAASSGGGPWQTGTGNVDSPRGDGNGDLYLAPDGVHPNVIGSGYLGERIATDLRAALLALA